MYIQIDNIVIKGRKSKTYRVRVQTFIEKILKKKIEIISKINKRKGKRKDRSNDRSDETRSR